MGTNSKNYTKHIPKLLERQNGLCYYCGEKLIFRGKNKQKCLQYATGDHVVPRSENGTNNIENLVASCGACNSVKGSMPVEKFISILDLDDVEFNKFLQKRKEKRVKEDQQVARKRARKRRSGLLKRFTFLWMYFPELAQEFKDAIEADPEGAYDSICGGRRYKVRAEKTSYEIKLKNCRDRRHKNKNISVFVTIYCLDNGLHKSYQRISN